VVNGPNETCDPPGSDPPPPGGNLCRTDCTYCGDGVTQTQNGEQCDDANNVDNDGCHNDCTLGPTPTPTATPAEPPLDHFQCYEMPREPFQEITGVSLVDHLGPSTVDVIRPKRLCSPASKNGEDPSAPDHPDYLTGYKIVQRTSFIKRRDITVSNQFGTVVIDIVRPEFLFVPSAVSLSAPPPPLAGPAVDHFKCYRAVRAKTRIPNVIVDDPFGTFGVAVKKPVRVCLAVDKNGEGILDATAQLLCYKIRQVSQPVFRGFAPVFENNQFEETTTSVDHIRDLCVPSSVALP
jgi:cysteine-rich repeat protein